MTAAALKERVEAAQALAAKATQTKWTLRTVRTSSGLCHKVGPFPWRHEKENDACVYDDYPGVSGGTPELVANAQLIAAAPDHVALIGELWEALQAAEAEIDALREDKERLDWLQDDHTTRYVCHTQYGSGPNLDAPFDGWLCGMNGKPKPTIREAIDAARGKG